eukprot:GHVS01080521.1.p1 GENE.GHVS01080521.1~~GHVS01080521.1.p1  ORF type:complete len:384 (-),score=34.29 GHVS01080521.1:282-1328(-)
MANVTSPALPAHSKRQPFIRWGQDDKRIYLKLDLSAHTTTEESRSDAAAFGIDDVIVDVLCRNCFVCDTSLYHTRVGLYDQVIAIDNSNRSTPISKGCLTSSHAKVEGSHSLSVVLVKEPTSARINWPSLYRPEEASVLKQWVNVDWNRWDSTDDADAADMIPPEHDGLPNCPGTQASSVRAFATTTGGAEVGSLGGGIMFSEKDLVPLDECPDLTTLGCFDEAQKSKQDAACLIFFSQSMTTAQRMHTMVKLWNELEGKDRIDCLQLMVKLCGGDADLSTLAARMKGGGEVVGDLDPVEYRKGGVTYCRKWVQGFRKLQKGDQLKSLSAMFQALEPNDQRVILSTFV